MGFFDDLGKTLSQAGQSMADKAKEMSEVASIKSQISAEQKNISECYSRIGEQYYNAHKDDENNEFADMVNAIKASLAKIEQLNEDIRKVKNIKLCPSCGAECESTVKFCASCGTKLPEPEPVVVEPAAGKKFCVSCNAEISADANFCVNCGSTQPPAGEAPAEENNQ